MIGYRARNCDTINYNLASAVHRYSLATPDALAVVAGASSATYGEMADYAARLAECLKQSKTWSVQDEIAPRVGILASRSVDACIALIGASWAGATYVPLGTKLPEERILTLLSLCNLTAIIADTEGAKLLSEKVLGACPPLVIAPNVHALHPPKCSDINLIDIESLSTNNASEPAQMGPDDTAYIIFTSGTTGVPKGVIISLGSVQHFVNTITPLLGLQASDRFLGTCELTFDVSVFNMFTTWQVGASHHILPANRVMNAVKYASAAEITVWSSVPSLVGMLRQAKILNPNVLPNLRITGFGGEQLTAGVVDAWRIAAPNSLIYNLYGPTEVTVWCLTQLVTQPIPLTPERDFVTIGKPLLGCEAVILDANGEVVADGMTGELAIAGVQLSTGYLNQPELTATRFPMLRGKQWYLTGDLAMQDTAGIFHCLGRIDNQVKVLGHRIELEEVDVHLRTASNINVVGTVAWPLLDGAAQGLVSFVGAKTIDSNQVIADLKTRLPAYMIPSRVIALENMPFNQSGKIDRPALRQLLEHELL